MPICFYYIAKSRSLFLAKPQRKNKRREKKSSKTTFRLFNLCVFARNISHRCVDARIKARKRIYKKASHCPSDCFSGHPVSIVLLIKLLYHSKHWAPIYQLAVKYKKSHPEGGFLLFIYQNLFSNLAPDHIQCTACFEPLDLLFIICMVNADLIFTSVFMIQHYG